MAIFFTKREDPASLLGELHCNNNTIEIDLEEEVARPSLGGGGGHPLYSEKEVTILSSKKKRWQSIRGRVDHPLLLGGGGDHPLHLEEEEALPFTWRRRWPSTSLGRGVGHPPYLEEEVAIPFT